MPSINAARSRTRSVIDMRRPSEVADARERRAPGTDTGGQDRSGLRLWRRQDQVRTHSETHGADSPSDGVGDQQFLAVRGRVDPILVAHLALVAVVAHGALDPDEHHPRNGGGTDAREPDAADDP